MNSTNDNESGSKDDVAKGRSHRNAADDSARGSALSGRSPEPVRENTDEVPTVITPVPRNADSPSGPGEIDMDADTRLREPREPRSTPAESIETPPPAPPISEPEVTVWGDFEIYETIGQGGMGTVYKGRQISLDRLVAVKVLPINLATDEKFLKRFELEAKALAKISSPQVVQVIAAGKHEDQQYFVMEFIEGNDLAERLKMGFRPTFRESVDIIQQAARGLSVANEYDIIHRDIKPGNIMITRKGLVKITDFGLVKIISGEVTDLTMAGTAMGTVSYFSPEQGRGDYCDHRTDIYALGVVLYELLTGILPFRGDNPTSVIYQHNHVQPVSPREMVPEIPEEYQDVVLKCLQKSPDNRYQSANDLIADIERLKQGKGLIPEILDPKNREREFFAGLEEPPRKHRKRLISRRFIAAVSTIFTFAVILVAIGLYVMKSDYLSRKRVRALLSDHKFIQSREVIDSHLAVAPTDAKWIVLHRKLNLHEAKYFIKLATAQFNRGHFAAAGASAQRILETNPKDRHALFVLARLEKREKDLEQARKFLLNGDYSLSRDLGNSYLRVNSRDADWLEVKAELDAIEGESLLETAKRAFAANEVKDARMHAVRALMLSIDKEPATLFIKRLDARDDQLRNIRKLIEREAFEESRKVVNENLAAFPNDAGWGQLLKELNQAEGEKTLQLAIGEFDKAEYEVARAHISRVLELLPNNQDARVAAANYEERDRVIAETRANIGENRFLEARRLILAHKDSWRNDPIWSDLLEELNQGEEKWALKQAHAALEHWDTEAAFGIAQRVLALRPENREAKNIIERLEERARMLAHVTSLIEGGEFVESRKQISTKLKDAANDPAWGHLQRILNNQEGNSLLAKARVAYESGDYEAANMMFGEARKLIPGNVLARDMVQQLKERERILTSIKDLRLRGDFPGCRQAIAAAERAWPNDPVWDELLKELNKVETEAVLELAQKQWGHGKFNDSRQSARDVLELFPDNRTAAELIKRIDDRENALRSAELLFATGDYEGCRKIVESAVAKSPSDHEWRALGNRLANALVRAGGGGSAQAAGTDMAKSIDAVSPTKASDSGPDLSAGKGLDASSGLAGASAFTGTTIPLSGSLVDPEMTPAVRDVKQIRALLKDKRVDFQTIKSTFKSIESKKHIGERELQELRALMSDRRRENRLNQLFRKLDSAVRNGNRARLVMILQDRNHAVALSSLMGQPGLVFEHILQSFRIEDNRVIAVVIMRHALAGLPETDLFYEYRLRRKDDSWSIAEVVPLDSVDGEE